MREHVQCGLLPEGPDVEIGGNRINEARIERKMISLVAELTTKFPPAHEAAGWHQPFAALVFSAPDKCRQWETHYRKICYVLG